jgi:hypothetical protein
MHQMPPQKRAALIHHFYPLVEKKWEDSAAQEMIPDDRESALEAAVGEALSN